MADPHTSPVEIEVFVTGVYGSTNLFSDREGRMKVANVFSVVWLVERFLLPGK